MSGPLREGGLTHTVYYTNLHYII